MNTQDTQSAQPTISDEDYAAVEALMNGEQPPVNQGTETKTEEASQKADTEEGSATNTGTEKSTDTGSANINEWYKGFGDFDSEESFKAHYESLGADKKRLETETVAYKTKQEELAKAIEEEKGKHKMFTDDPAFAKLAILKNNKEENLEIFAKLALDQEVDPRKLLQIQVMKDMPDLDPKLIDKVIDKKYGLNTEKPEDAEELADWEMDQQIKKAQMKTDANGILAKYKEKLDGIELPTNTPPSKEELALRQVAAKEKWEPALETVVKSVGNIKFEIDLDGKNVPIEVELSSDQLKEYSNVLSNLVHDNAIDFNREELTKVSDTMRRLISENQRQAIHKAIVEKVAAERDAFWEAKVNGRGAPDFKANANPIDKTGYDAVAAAVHAAYSNH
jgi:hypothetical protein